MLQNERFQPLFSQNMFTMVEENFEFRVEENSRTFPGQLNKMFLFQGQLLQIPGHNRIFPTGLIQIIFFIYWLNDFPGVKHEG
jgi:hypothetical protein